MYYKFFLPQSYKNYHSLPRFIWGVILPLPLSPPLPLLLRSSV